MSIRKKLIKRNTIAKIRPKFIKPVTEKYRKHINHDDMLESRTHMYVLWEKDGTDGQPIDGSDGSKFSPSSFFSLVMTIHTLLKGSIWSFEETMSAIFLVLMSFAFNGRTPEKAVKDLLDLIPSKNQNNSKFFVDMVSQATQPLRLYVDWIRVQAVDKDISNDQILYYTFIFLTDFADLFRIIKNSVMSIRKLSPLTTKSYRSTGFKYMVNLKFLAITDKFFSRIEEIGVGSDVGKYRESFSQEFSSNVTVRRSHQALASLIFSKSNRKQVESYSKRIDFVDLYLYEHLTSYFMEEVEALKSTRNIQPFIANYYSLYVREELVDKEGNLLVGKELKDNLSFEGKELADLYFLIKIMALKVTEFNNSFN